ncbi:hypothetical protein A9B99_02580 [Mangrovibacter phragmitis]|uniref:Uncharacterized protein n=1 Tax=Mangrovibacter phragmitis TaxID=1691903 RepID=A0A1B7L8L7_9ENTR|nr:hypothetical protein [Mangrovibacter phragmitis]OAT78625.1 hypothetical protein A9B99_02580 [Mangrovibacter phragmitis]
MKRTVSFFMRMFEFYLHRLVTNIYVIDSPVVAELVNACSAVGYSILKGAMDVTMAPVMVNQQ